MVALHAFIGLGYLGLCTGQTFGDNASPANFDIAAVVRQDHASYLWQNDHERCTDEAKEYVENMSFDVQCEDTQPFQTAAPTSITREYLIRMEREIQTNMSIMSMIYYMQMSKNTCLGQ